MSESVCLGDGIADEAKTEFNNRAGGLVKLAINMVFDYLENHVKIFRMQLDVCGIIRRLSRK